MTTTGAYDVIVIGMGAMGSATVYELASRGLRVLGLERFDIGHDRGSSHGVSRIIRLAYSEHPSYVPLLRRAYERWRELESAAARSFCTSPAPWTRAGPRARCSAAPWRPASSTTCRTRPSVARRLLDVFPAAGFRRSGCPCTSRTAGSSCRSGASSRTCLPRWSAAPTCGPARRCWSGTPPATALRVETTRGSYEAGALVITTGAWAGPLVPSLDHLLAPERQVLGWFQPLRPELFAPSAFPVVIGEFEEGKYYASPVFGVPGFKIGKFHHLNEATTAEGLDRECRDEDEAVLRQAVARYFPDANGPAMSLRACMFTNTPDEHFLIDALPGAPNVYLFSRRVVLGPGGETTAFKFSSVVGEILADLSTRGFWRPAHDISLFRLDRFAARRGPPPLAGCINTASPPSSSARRRPR